jgi:uncharacterized protein YkwD
MIFSVRGKTRSRIKISAVVLSALAYAMAPEYMAQDRPPYASPSTSAHLAAHPAAKTVGEKSSPSAAEKLLFEQLNESRVLAGLAPLHWDGKLAAAAHEHCVVMVRHEALSHQFAGEPDLLERISGTGAAFSALAENVAVAPTAEEIHYEWMHSPPHRANILDPKLTAVGVAAIQGHKGVYAVQDFSLARERLSLAEQEETVRTLISATGVRISDDPSHSRQSDARRTCKMKESYSGSPSSIVRFESSDLNELPSRLESALREGKFHSAAVGACAPEGGESEGFTHFRLAVLLYTTP